MAHLLRHYSFTSTSVWTEARLHHQAHASIKLSNHRQGRWKICGKKRASGNGCVVQCCTSSSSSAAAKAGVELTGNVEEDNNGRRGEKEVEQPLYLASEYGWKVRRLEEDQPEITKVAQIQAEAFHQPMAFFDDLFFQFFQVSFIFLLFLFLHLSFSLRFPFCLFFRVYIFSIYFDSPAVLTKTLA